MQVPKGSSEEVMFGVSTEKDSAFYSSLQQQQQQQANVDADDPKQNGTALMKKVPINDEDTVGVAVQQSDLPMIQFLVNGEPLHKLAINRFRGQVFPAIYLPSGENVKATLVLNEENFKELAPSARFGPIIAAIGLI
mmetsp:Transcript_32763/g.46555  ORF Transcript_32763/g.46555 Transcript_32763/m.46555 type:complete len:137 (-) Transcript_32763:192-602(-)